MNRMHSWNSSKLILNSNHRDKRIWRRILIVYSSSWNCTIDLIRERRIWFRLWIRTLWYKLILLRTYFRLRVIRTLTTIMKGRFRRQEIFNKKMKNMLLIDWYTNIRRNMRLILLTFTWALIRLIINSTRISSIRRLTLSMT